MKKKKSKFVNMLREARRLKSVGVKKEHRRMLILSKEMERYCDRNKITGRMRDNIIGLASLKQHMRLSSISQLWTPLDKKAFKPLLSLLKDRDPEVIETAIEALGKLGDKRAFKPLLEFLEREDDSFRTDAIQALGDLKDARAVKPLIKLLSPEKESYFVWELSVEALGKVGDKKSIPHLLPLLNTTHIQIEEGTIKALYDILMRNSEEKDVTRMRKGGRFLYNGLGKSLETKTLLIGLMLDPKKKRLLPTDYRDKNQRDKIEYMVNLRQQAKEYRFDEILIRFGLRKARKEKKE